MKNLIVAILVLALEGCVADMGTPYTPNPAAGTWTSVTLPDDGDLKNVASVDVPFQAIADKQARHIDGVSGGTYTPSAPVNIQGAGINTDLLTVGTGGIGNIGTTSCLGPLVSTDGATFSGGTFTCNEPSSFTQTVTCSNATNALTATGPVSISGANGSFFSGGTGGSQFATPVQVNAALKLTAGGFLQLQYAALPDLDQTISVGSGQLFVAGIPAWTGAHVIRFTNTGAGAGDFVIVEMLSGTAGHAAQIKRDDGTVIITLVNTGTPGDKYHVVLYHNGGDWFVGPITVLP